MSMIPFSDECKKAFQVAVSLAKQSGGLLGTEHILTAFMQESSCDAYEVLKKFSVDGDKYEQISIPYQQTKVADYQISNRVNIIINNCKRFAINNSLSEINSVILLMFTLMQSDSVGVNNLERLGIDVNSIIDYIKSDVLNIEEETEDNPSQGVESILSSFFGGQQDMGQSQKPKAKGIKGLEKYGEDLTEKAKQGKLDPVIGRKDEIDRVIQILSRRTKNNPVLIGEPGVGKSAVVEGLAQAIVRGDVPEMLKDKKIFSLDLTSMVAGAKYRGEFEERIKDAIDIVKKDKSIILFIDEIHMIVGAGDSSDGAMDAANILKPQLARGELQTIGATTIEEYRKYIEKDAALERRFQPVTVDPPTVEDTVLILKGLKEKYEKHHKVKILDEAIEAAANLSDRYIQDRYLPDKAIDLIDEAASKKHIGASVVPKDVNAIEEKINKLTIEMKNASDNEEYDKAGSIKAEITKLKNELENKKKEWKEAQSSMDLELTEEDIADVVSLWTKIPVAKLTQSESERLLNLENILRNRVVGQDEAVSAVSKAVRRARVGIKDPKRPIGSFIFLGPTGVGKTELSKALAEAMFGDENLMIRIDMSEYMEAINVSKLIGSAPGYVGYDEGGQLTEKVRRNPYSVVLFDEIEKAHPDVFNILLQILEDGRLTDSHGRTVSFKNTIVIMTSNIGASELKSKSLGFGSSDSKQDYEEMKERQMSALKKTLKPEFINRIDDIIIFRSFEKKDMRDIALLMVESLSKRLKERGINIIIDDSALDVIIDKGFNAEYGARPLRRALQSMVEDELATKMLLGDFNLGDKILIEGEDGKLIFKKDEE